MTSEGFWSCLRLCLSGHTGRMGCGHRKHRKIKDHLRKHFGSRVSFLSSISNSRGSWVCTPLNSKRVLQKPSKVCRVFSSWQLSPAFHCKNPMGLQCFFYCLHHSLWWTAAWFQPQDLPEVLPMAMSTTEPSQPAWSKPIKTIQLNARKFIIPEVMWQAAAGRKEARWYPTWQNTHGDPLPLWTGYLPTWAPVKRPTMVTAHRLQNIANSWRKGTLVAALAPSELFFAPIHSYQPELTSSCCSCCMLNNPAEGAKIFVLLEMAPSIALLSHSSTQPSISFCSTKLPGFPLCSTMPGKSWGLTLSPGGSEWISISISHNYSYIIFENPTIHHCTWENGGCWRALLACALTTWPFFARSTADMQRWTSPVCNSKDRQCVHNALQIRMIYVPLNRDMSLLTCELERRLEGGGCHGKCHADPVSATTKCQYCKSDSATQNDQNAEWKWSS